MPIILVFVSLRKSRFFVIYYRCVTLADGTGNHWLQSVILYGTIRPTKERKVYEKSTFRMPREYLQKPHGAVCFAGYGE